MNLRWEELPFCLLTPEQQIQLRNQAEIGRYQTGNIIWSTDEPGSQFLIISGNVRLREEGKPQSLAILKAGDCFGDLLELSGNFKAVASSGERGTSLSGGQRQRIALSRLFLSQAPILILDEATSGLDSETEQKVLQNLQEVKGARTVFMIAHRFGALKRADLILVLEKGEIVERGNHEELLEKRGVYFALYQRQIASV